MTQQLPQLLNGAKPQFYKGGRVGCLVIHGFMASPGEVGWLGSHLAGLGLTVYVPRLTGHGYLANHMTRMRWEDWYGQVLDGYQILRQQCDTVHVVGHSMGGLLGMLLAMEHDVERLVVAAAPVLPPRRIMRFAHWLSWFMRFTHHPNEDWLQEQILSEQARRGEPEIGRIHYDRWSTRAVYELYRLIGVVDEYLPRLQTPMLLLYAQQDMTSPIRNMEHIASTVASTHIEQHVLQEGAHIIFQDKACNEACEVVAKFLCG
jgi:carboxylesterase